MSQVAGNLVLCFPYLVGNRETQNPVSECLSKHCETNLDYSSTSEQLFRYSVAGMLLNKVSWSGCGYEIIFHYCFETVVRHFWICWGTVSDTVYNVSCSGLGFIQSNAENNA